MTKKFFNLMDLILILIDCIITFYKSPRVKNSIHNDGSISDERLLKYIFNLYINWYVYIVHYDENMLN